MKIAVIGDDLSLGKCLKKNLQMYHLKQLVVSDGSKTMLSSKIY